MVLTTLSPSTPVEEEDRRSRKNLRKHTTTVKKHDLFDAITEIVYKTLCYCFQAQFCLDCWGNMTCIPL